MSRIELSWLNAPTISSASDVIEEMPSLSGNISDVAVLDRIVYKIMYLRNNGPSVVGSVPVDPVAYNAGFYVQPWGPEHSDNHNFEKLMQWSTLSDGDGRPYGCFTVFGYDDNAGTNSYIAKFIANTLTPTELSYFQHNWVQGSSAANSIRLDTAFRYDGTNYVENKHFEAYELPSVSIGSSETKGLLRVLFGVRIPNTIEATRVLTNHTLFYEEAI